ncbi:MAG: ABC transporter substrate-binding protein [Desulfobulbaceae bacterium]|nr:MAG: ABC transporter substrate-binding protein [Desulfobulbaceae bacterium]
MKVAREKSYRLSTWFALLSTVAVLLMLSQPVWASAPQRGGVLKINTIGLDTSDIHRHTGSIGVPQVFVESLTSISDTGQPVPWLAESWEITPDGKTYTFTIRQGVKFHNGRTMTADDVMQNFSRVKSEVEKGWLSGAMKKISGFETPGEYTFVVKMSEPYAPFLNLISELWIMAPESEGWDKTITQPIGTGPFMFGTWNPQVSIHCPRFDQYWMKGQPYLDAVEFDLRDKSQPALGLRSGDYHISKLSGKHLPQVKKEKDITLEPIKDTGWYFWSFNNRSPRKPFDNVKVRQAISYALDKKAYMNFIAKENGIITNQMAKPGTFYWSETLHEADTHLEPNIELAKKILKEEGVVPEDITMKIVSWQTADYAQVAVQMVKQLGFKVEHLALDDLAAMKQLMQFDWDLAPFASGPRADIFMRFVRMMTDGPNPGLWGGVQDPMFDKLCEDAVSTVDDERRRALYLMAWQRALDYYYTVVAGHAPNFFGVRNEVQDFKMGWTYSMHRPDSGIAFAWLKK